MRSPSTAPPASRRLAPARHHAPGQSTIRNIRIAAFAVLLACSPVQYFLDPSLNNLICTLITICASGITILYTCSITRFRRAPMSCLMLLGFNVSAMSAALVIQSIDGRPITYNLKSAIDTFSVLALTQLVSIAVHWIYVKSKPLRGLRGWCTRRLAMPLGLLEPPTNPQLWIFGAVGCLGTILSARSYTDAVSYGNVSGKFLLGYIPFAVAPFFIPMRSNLLGDDRGSARANLPALVGYAGLLIGVAMANNARATFSSGFLTLGLCGVVAVLSGNLRLTRRTLVTGAVLSAAALPLFLTLSDLATAMVIARDERSNVSSLELIEITLRNFGDKALIAQRQRLDAIISGGDYDENYVNNPLLARFVYTKFVDVNMSNAISVSDSQAAQIRANTADRILAMLPTPVLNYFKINVDKSQLDFSSGDIYSYLARGLELGGFTTGSEVPDGLTIMGFLFWPALSLMVLAQFVIYDSFCFTTRQGKVAVSAVALLNAVPIFTLGIMQESVSNQVIAIVRGVPQLILLYWVLAFASAAVTRPAALSRRILARFGLTTRRGAGIGA